MITATTTRAPAAKEPLIRNIEASISSPLSLGFQRPRTTITATQIKKTIPIRSKKGTVDQSAPGSQLLCMEKASKKPPTMANRAPAELVFFQKNPNKNAAKRPGETNPVISWIN